MTRGRSTVAAGAAAPPGTQGLAAAGTPRPAPGTLVADGRCVASRQDTDVLFHFIVSELIPVTHFSALPRALVQIVTTKGSGVAAATSRRPCCVCLPSPGSTELGTQWLTKQEIVTCLPLLLSAGGGDLGFKQAFFSWCFQYLKKKYLQPSDKRSSDISVARSQTGCRK